MIQLQRRVGPRTAVFVGPVGAALIALAMLAVAAWLALRAAEVLLVLGFFYGVGRLTRRIRGNRHRR